MVFSKYLLIQAFPRGHTEIKNDFFQPLLDNQGEALLEGRFPFLNQFGSALSGARAEKAGKTIANGWRGGFDAWTGDWKERSLSHNFSKRNYMSMRVCDQCDAVKPFKRTPQQLLFDVHRFSTHCSVDPNPSNS